MSTQFSACKFNILVVDDDVTSLSVISSMLRTLQYEVFAVKCPLKALPINRFRDLDLVLSDLHMPKMNGLQLQKQIEAQSKLPVIIMSSDDDENIMLKSLSSGAVFFISKPVNPMDLKNLWQYAIASKRDKSMRYIEKIGSIQATESLLIGKTSYNDENHSGVSVDKEDKGKKKDGKRKSRSKDKEKVGEKNSAASKKTKVVWNNTLHNRFMQAIRHITLEKAVPKKILEFMNVPGLTRENVASHLQKYRIFLKKVAEKGFVGTSKNSMTLDRTFQSSFAAGHYSMMYHNFQEAYSPFKALEKQPSPLQSFNPNKFGLISGLSSGNSEFASSSSTYGFGQSHLLGSNIQANVHKTFLGNTNSLIHPNCSGIFGHGSNDIGTNMLSAGRTMRVSGTNSMQVSNNLSNNMPTPSTGTSEIFNPSYVAVGNNIIDNAGTKNISFSDPNLNLNYFNNNNHGGIQMNNDGNLAPAFGLVGKAVGDSTSGTCLAESEFSSARFNHEKCQFPTSLPNVNFEQVRTSALPSLTQQQSGLSNGELNDFVSDLMNDNDTSCISEPQQFDKFVNKQTESTDFQLSDHQQQGGESLQNLNFASGLSNVLSETNPPVSQPRDDLDHFLSSCNVEENYRWDEPSLEQLLEIEEFLNPELVDNHPVLDKNHNKDSDDDFMDYLLSGRL